MSPSQSDYLDSTVQELGLPADVVKKLAKAKLSSVRQLLSSTVMDIRHAGCTKEEADLVFSKAVQKRYCIESTEQLSAAYLQPVDLQRFRLSFGCNILDESFDGGLLTYSLTEFTGSAGVGKTQICLQLALSGQLPVENGGLNGEVIYLCTENLPAKRLKQFADRFSAENAASSLDRIYVEMLSTFDEVLEFLTGRIFQLLAQKPIKLLIVDSITAIFRYVDEKEDTTSVEHTRKIQQVASCLQFLVNRHNLTVVCTNQVTSDFSESAESQEPLPSLGITWANFVNTRIVLSKTYKRKDLDSLPEISRTMRIDFSPCLPQKSVYFAVTENCVRGIK